MRVLFFAHLKEVTGQPEWVTEVDETDLDGLWRRLITAFPNLARFRESVRIARNWQYAEAGTRFLDTDEVALIPPVSGG